MSLKPGQIVTLEVARLTDFGYFLTDQVEDVLLHKKQTKGSLEVGQKVEVFLFQDHQGRLAGTMEEPIITFGDIGWLEVVSINERDGVFLYNGIVRDLFLSVDDLGTDRSLWPRVGEKVPVSLTYDKKGRLMGRLMRGASVEDSAEKAPKTILNQEVTGTIYSFVEKGVFLLTEEGFVAFLHFQETDEELHLGQTLQGRVTFVRDDGRINISVKPRSHERRDVDAEKIYEFILKRDGGMPYTDQSDPAIIKQKFGMSKGAFKRAIGKLLKEGLIYQKEGWTYKKE
ncbi:MAG: S1-like domain-containing RNA-binding protein [Bacillaceae bacterium]|nr:S1-like domain-containing RNA-binding protein [Bacillaceae bacterium]